MIKEPAILAGGCHLGPREVIRLLATRVGYIGGDVGTPIDFDLGTHAEAVEVVVNSDVPSCWDLLEFVFQVHDPTTRNRQKSPAGINAIGSARTGSCRRPVRQH